MKKFSQVLLLTVFGFTGTIAIADESVPLEATAAAEAQQIALEYGDGQGQGQKSDSPDE
ncbi:hypothetical protein [Acinetobacter pecorum]|uniref:Secreted protein n=1 Tax=Acinetobacter pecorum TaxID=2762215 RepID=A0ABR8W0S7_9GAMM|nr:hypothetical protein [Acinetobacter pecorum]MBD8010588.1 hypothetical protein [Acinetobacter pecorum]